MPARKEMQKRPISKFLRLTPFQRGMIFMGSLAGLSPTDIAGKLEKQGGGHPSVQAVADSIAQARAHGGSQWDGRPQIGGRPRDTADALDKAISKLVFKKRGSVVVIANYVRRELRGARSVSIRTIQRRVREAGLRWLRRRRKFLVSEIYKEARLQWADWVLSLTSAMSRWAYTDGTSFYLARTAEEVADKGRAALGTHVWRAADGHDALFEDCLGPSSYAKAQGNCVRV